MHRIHTCALLACALLHFLPGVAVAQTDFVPAQPYFSGPIGQIGVNFDVVDLEVEVDTDGDGQIEAGEGVYPAPPALTQTVAGAELRLSPSRQHVIVRGTAINGPCQGQPAFYVYGIPAQNGDPLLLLGPPICADQGLAFEGFFDPDVTGTNDTFFVAEVAHPTTLDQQVWFKSLSDGTTASGFAFDRSVGELTFAPTGIAAFVQYDTSDGDNLDSYQMIELCADDFGQYVGVASGSVVDVTGGGVATARQLNATDVEVLRASDQASIAFYTLDDCSGPPPETGACCLGDGSCASGATEAGCIAAGGTWQGAGTDCAGVNCPPPPSVEWVLTGSGPASFEAPGLATYTIDWRNDGQLPADGVVLVAIVPTAVTFDSATGGGSYNALNRRVTWSLGAVGANTSGQVSFTVDVACGVNEVVFDQYFVQSTTPLTFQFGTDVVRTAVSQGGGGPLTVSSSSISDTGNPPGDGDTVTHTITLVETDGAPRRDVRFAFNVGTVWAYDATVDAGGGAITLNGSFLTWTGDVPANGTVDVSFRTRVPDCRSSHQLSDALNTGLDFNVFSACNALLGTASVTRVDLAPLPVVGDITIVGAGPTTTGGFFGELALARKGSTLEVEARIDATTSAAVPNARLVFTVPTGLAAVGSPPWIGTPPAGATWDAPTQTASWAGTVPAGGSVVFRLAMQWPVDGPCQAFTRALYGYGACSNAGDARLVLYGLPEPIASPHLISVTNSFGLWSYTPGVDTEQQEFFCESFEILGGVGAGRGGDIFVAGTPSFRINPVSLEIEFLDDVITNRLNMYAPSDIAVDPNTGVVYFVGRRIEPGPMSWARVGSWDPVTDQTRILLDDPLNARVHIDCHRADVLADGRLAVSTYAGVVIVDPLGTPGSETIWTDPTWAQGTTASGVAGLPDGTLLAADNLSIFGDSKSIRIFDPDTGLVGPYVADMLSIFPVGVLMYGLDASDTGDAWLATGAVARITPDPTPSLGELAIGGFGQKLDVAWRPGTGTSTGVDDDVADRGLPRVFALHAPVPNPFNPRTTFAFDLPREAQVDVALFDARGRRVRTLAQGVREAGAHRVIWNGTDDQGHAVSSGVYFLRMEGAGQRFVRKAVLLR